MYVIPLVLEEVVAQEMPEHLLRKLAACSTPLVKGKIKVYLENPAANPKTVIKVQEAYRQEFARDEYLQNEELALQVRKIESLEYWDIYYELPQKVLEEYAEILNSVLHSEYATAYVEPISGSIISELIDEVIDYSETSGKLEFYQLGKRLSQYSELFKDAKTQKNRGTVFKKILLNTRKFETILKGIEFLIEKKKLGADPRSWRLL